MGRYAQRRRSGGGPPGAPPLIQMTEGIVDGSEVAVVYDGDVTAGDFELTDFLFSDGAQNPTSIAQNASNELLLELLTTVDEGDLTYSGDVSGVLTPQTIELTIL